METISRWVTAAVLVAVGAVVVSGCQGRGDAVQQVEEEGSLAGSSTETGLRMSLHLVEGVLVGTVTAQHVVADGIVSEYADDRALYDAVETTIRVNEEWRGTVRARDVMIVDSGSEIGHFERDPNRRESSLRALPLPRLPPPGEQVVVIYGRRPGPTGRYPTGSVFTVLSFPAADDGRASLPEERGTMLLERLHAWMEEIL
ncbi:MAG: hypothetical protein HY905_08140 [Deltaproteobacteria bacterium]|nr:hypothetical protein [Deltaproteobacteria bacterium]